MSNLKDLIKQLCPDGVEYCKIGEIADYEQPTKYIVKSTYYNNTYQRQGTVIWGNRKGATCRP